MERFQELSGFGPEDVLRQAREFDEQQAKKSFTRRCTQRISPFLKFVTVYSSLVTSLVQYAPAPTSIVWGGVMSVVQLMVQYTSYFEKIVALFEEIGEILSPFTKYAENLYSQKPSVQDALAELYGDLLQFVSTATSVFLNRKGRPKSGLEVFVTQIWRTFESQFDDIKTQFERHSRIIEREMAYADREVFYQDTQLQNQHREITQSKLEALTDLSNRGRNGIAGEQRKALLLWLSTLDFRNSHEKAAGSRYGTTGTWLLKSDQFQEWFHCTNSTLLYCAGKPGSGKSVLASLVIEKLHERSHDYQTPLAFVYCDSRERDSSTASLLVASLLKQFCATATEIPRAVRIEYEKSLAEGTTNLTWAAVKDMFKEMLQTMSRQLTIVFDGLDECDDPSSICDWFDECLLQTNAAVRFFVTTRSENALVKPRMQKFAKTLLSEELLKSDITGYIKAEVERLVQMGTLKLGALLTKQDIIETLIRKAEGMFLWVRFQLEALCSQTTDHELRKALDTLPFGLKTVYQRALTTIDESPPQMRALARKVIVWVLFARRSLLLSELVEALAIMPGSGSDPGSLLPEHRLTKPYLIISACADLLSMDERGFVQFVHSSIRDFLLDHDRRMFRSQDFRISYLEANSYMARSCLTYLIMGDVNRQTFETEEQMQSFFTSHCFAAYSSWHWSDHVREVEDADVNSLVYKMLKQEESTSSWRIWPRAFEYDKPGVNILRDIKVSHPLAVMIDQNLLYTLAHYPNIESLLETQGLDDMTPLLYAIKQDNISAAMKLLDMGADPLKTTNQQQTALHLAVRGSESLILVARLLYAGIDRYAVSNLGGSAFDYAAANRRLDALKMLVQDEPLHEKFVNAISLALTSAAVVDDIGIVEFLVTLGAKVDHFDENGWTALHHATYFDKQKSVLKLLSMLILISEVPLDQYH